MKNRVNTLIRVVLCLALIMAVVPTPVFAESVTISARAEGGGKIQIGDREPAVSDSVIVEKGSPAITIKAIPDDGYRLSYWGDDTYASGTPGQTEKTVSTSSGSTTVAHFYPAGPISVTMSDIDMGCATVGYTVNSGSVEYPNYNIRGDIKISRPGTIPLAPADPPIVLNGDAANYFSVVYDVSRGGLSYRWKVVSQSSSTFYWIIVPKPDLPVGVYEGTFSLIERCQPAFDPPLTANVRFEVTDDYVINTAASPSSGGTVEGAGRYSAGQEVTLTAIPNEHYRFVKWNDGNTDNPRTFEASEAKTYTATFELYEFNITAKVNGNGKIQINDRPPAASDTVLVEKGTPLTIKAIPDEDYRLSYWDDTTYAIGDPGSTTRTVSPSSSTTYTAYIYPKEGLTASLDDIDLGVASEGYKVSTGGSYPTYYIKGDAHINISGSIPLAPTGIRLDDASKEYFQVISTNNTYRGAVVSVSRPYFYWSIIPKEGLAPGTYNGTFTLVERCQPAFDPPLTASVTFKVTAKYLITTTVDPEGKGTVEGGGEYDEGEEVTLTATPAENFVFDHWEVGGVNVSSSSTYVFEASQNQTVKAVFQRSKYNINVSVYNGVGGTVSLSGTSELSVNLTPGATITASASPSTGYAFDYWTLNGVRTGDGAAVTLEAIADQTLVAHFALIEYNVTVNCNTGGSVNVNKPKAKMGETVTLTPSSQSGYEFVRWEPVTPYDLVITSNSFVMPAKDVTVNAVFVKVVTIPAAVEGLIYSGSEQTGVPAGADYTITNNKATKIGTYTATLTLKDPVNSKWNDGTVTDKEIEWTIEFPGGADYMLEGKVSGADLGYVITARNDGTQKLLAARYVDGQLADVRMIDVALVAGENTDDDAFAGFCTGGSYKLFLLDGDDLSPLCEN